MTEKKERKSKEKEKQKEKGEPKNTFSLDHERLVVFALKQVRKLTKGVALINFFDS